MFFNAVKTIVFISAVDFVTSAATSYHKSAAAAKRHDGGDYGNGAFESFEQYSNGAQLDHQFAASGGVGMSAMAAGWGSLTPAFYQFQSTLSAGVSIDVAVQAASALGAQVQSISSQYGSCGCSVSSQTSSQFQSMAVQFFLHMQSAIQIGQQRFGAEWETRFRAVCQQFTSAFVSLKAIAASIQFDLSAALQVAHINVQLFANVGLNLSSLLQLNLSLGGLLHL